MAGVSQTHARANGGDSDSWRANRFPSEWCLVTGGRGFVGRNLVKKLLEREWSVRIFDLAPQLSLSEEEKLGIVGTAVLQGRFEYVPGDLRNKEQVSQVVQGVSTVFHMAAPNPRINDLELHTGVTVEGTQNVIDACIEAGVKKLIYTSSASVVFDGINDIKNGDESMPYPEKPLDAYSATKAVAEQLVLKANGMGGLLTLCLRPSAVFGPGDNVFLPTLVSMARAGRMKFIIGSGENEMDFTYVENVVHAHICAEAHLDPGKALDDEDNASGKAYFVTNGEPRRFWDTVFEILTSLGYDPPKGSLPLSAVLLMAQGNELFRKALSPIGVPLGDFSPSRIRHTTTWRTFYSNRAARLLGYAPIVPLKEGLRRTIEASPQLRAENAPVETRDFAASKAHARLGGGKVADVLLWKDAAETAMVGSFASVLFYLLFMSKFTVVSLFANAAMVFLSICAVYGFLNKVLASFGYELWEIPSFEALEFSEDSAREIASKITVFVNAASPLFTAVLKGASWKVSVKAMVFFWLLAKVGRFALRAQIGILLFLAFSIPVLYDRNEDSVDTLAVLAKNRAIEMKDQTLSKLPPAVQSKLLPSKSKKRL